MHNSWSGNSRYRKTLNLWNLHSNAVKATSQRCRWMSDIRAHVDRNTSFSRSEDSTESDSNEFGFRYRQDERLIESTEDPSTLIIHFENPDS